MPSVRREGDYIYGGVCTLVEVIQTFDQCDVFHSPVGHIDIQFYLRQVFDHAVLNIEVSCAWMMTRI